MNKGKRGFLFEMSTLKKVFSVYVSISEKYTLAVFLQALLQSSVLMLYVFVPKLMIDGLTSQKEAGYFILIVALAVSVNYLFGLAAKRLGCYTASNSAYIASEFSRKVACRLMNVSFEKVEDSKFIEFKERALFPVFNRDVLAQLAKSFPDLIQCVLTIVGIAAILAVANPILILLIILTNFISYMLNVKKQERAVALTKKISSMNKEFGYLIRTIRSKESGREIRSYDASAFFMTMARDYDRRMFADQESDNDNTYGFDARIKLITALQNALAYVFIGIYALYKHLSIGNFSMYLSAVITFCATTNKLLDLFLQLRTNAKYLEDFIALYELETEEDNPGAEAAGRPDKIEIEFRDVYFRYPNTENYVLNGVSFTISDKETISIVGRNGAGKTTMIKLLARLYKPEKGEIRVNGKNINDYDYASYNRLLSVIFQDFKVFEFTIRENIALCDEKNEDADKKTLDAAGKAGADDFLSRLKHGAGTSVGTTFDEEGVSLSGGQQQKIAIARAVYKDGKMIVLDEPTAALDPIAEAETYEKLNELIDGKTAVYISHRLSSCKFCDRILLLDGGTITEEGTHDALMKHGGLYAEMFQLQADALLTGRRV